MSKHDASKLFSNIQENKSLIALPLEDLRAIDLSLASGWGIDFRDQADVISGFDRVVDRAAIHKYAEAYERTATKLSSKSSPAAMSVEADLFEAMSHRELLGVTVSEHRQFIIDGLASAIGVVRACGLTGSVLDLGCHAGFAATQLAENLPNEVVGLDACASAVNLGREWPAASPQVQLVERRFPCRLDRKFDLVYCVNSMPQKGSVGPYLSAIFEHLNDGGIAFIASEYWHVDYRADLVRRLMHAHGITFAFADVIGGYGGATVLEPPHFDTRRLHVLWKGTGPQISSNRSHLQQLAESEWSLFRDYANCPATPPREKTQAFERATRAERS